MTNDLYVFKEYFKDNKRQYEYLGFISNTVTGLQRTLMMRKYAEENKNCYVLFLKLVTGFQT